MDRAIPILGAGPAGLAAAITLARAGRAVDVFEKRRLVGGRFHGDFQGLENWSDGGDVLAELAALGIPADFEHRGFGALVMLNADGRRYPLHSEEPLFYLVRRGPGAGTLDTALHEEARRLGVRFLFRRTRDCLPEGGLVATGPEAVNVIAVGYTFATDATDAAYGVVDPELAPGGYGYLLIWNGRATLAACLFRDFHREQLYLERLTAFFARHLAIVPRDAKRFGGAGGFHWPFRLREGGILYAGEAAGLQDPLWGFGMRTALRSGVAAARALLADDPASYEAAMARDFGRRFDAGLVNRWCFERLGPATIPRVLRALDPAGLRAWLARRYAGAAWHRLLRPWLRRAHAAPALPEAGHACHCTFCTCSLQPQEETP